MVQYYADVEVIKFVLVILWVFWIIALGATYALGQGRFSVSTGVVARIIRDSKDPDFAKVILGFDCSLPQFHVVQAFCVRRGVRQMIENSFGEGVVVLKPCEVVDGRDPAKRRRPTV